VTARPQPKGTPVTMTRADFIDMVQRLHELLDGPIWILETSLEEGDAPVPAAPLTDVLIALKTVRTRLQEISDRMWTLLPADVEPVEPAPY
jgi:hypothetical protein